jgi:hypothetical protein
MRLAYLLGSSFFGSFFGVLASFLYGNSWIIFFQLTDQSEAFALIISTESQCTRVPAAIVL